MPAVHLKFSNEVKPLLQLAVEAETLCHTEHRLSSPHLRLIYELAFLGVFTAWETFLEDSFLRVLCGYTTPSGRNRLRQPAQASLDAALRFVLSSTGKDYLSWYQPAKVMPFLAQFIEGPPLASAVGGPAAPTPGTHETVFASAAAKLGWYAAVRHRIAHRSDYSRKQFDDATLNIAVRNYAESSPGRFLRDSTTAEPPRKYLSVIAEDLLLLASQAVA